MEDELVTLAIHTYERAVILKGILESEGIEVYLHNVNLIQPVISAGVRVRIKESDLPAALKIIEDFNFGEDKPQESMKPERKIILVPVDFSDYSIKAARFALIMAKTINANVVLLNTYYSPYYTGGMPVSDAFVYDETSQENLRTLLKKNHEEMDQLTNILKKDVADGVLPNVPVISKFREGVPEEQILVYSKKHKPTILIMGTHGKNAKNQSLIGSVTADVIEHSQFPVFAFPENTPFDRFEQINNIGFITNFNQRDLVAFESLLQLMKSYNFKVYFIHISNENESNQWNEIQLSGVKEYFNKQYPEIESSYCVIESGHLIDSLNDFIHERQIDVLAITNQKRNMFSRLFNPSLAHKMVFHSDTPLLVLKG